MKNNKKESQPSDMHSDGVHFDKEILESKRNESARASNPKTDTSKAIQTDDKMKSNTTQKRDQLLKTKLDKPLNETNSSKK